MVSTYGSSSTGMGVRHHPINNHFGKDDKNDFNNVVMNVEEQ